MKRIICIVVIIFISGTLFAQKTFLKWEKIPSPEFSAPDIVYGQSIDNFFVMDMIGILYHFKNNKWYNFPIKRRKSYTRIRYKYLSDSKIILSAVDSLWNSHIFLFNGREWIAEGIINNAVINVLYTPDKRLYFVGDWGTVVEYSHGRLIPIKTPFRNHILASDVNDKTIWLGVRGEGVFSFDGNTFKSYEVEGSSELEFARLSVSKQSSVTFYTADHLYYELKGKKFFKTTYPYKNSIPVISLESKTHYKINSEYLPYSNSDANVSTMYGYKQHLQFENSQILLLTVNNEIYKSRLSPNNYFDDCSTIFGLKGYGNITSYGAGFFYCDNDYLPDLYVHNNFTEIYLNKSGEHFTNTGNVMNLPKFASVSRFDFADVSMDGKTDFVNTEFLKQEPVVNIYNRNELGFSQANNLYPEGLSTKRHFENLRLIDFNKDGRIDIDVTLYFGSVVKSGNQVVSFNTGFDSFSGYDTSFANMTKGWNIQSVHADFNNDGLNDWLIVSRWRPLRIFFAKHNNQNNFDEFRFPGDTLTSYIGGFAFDYNNDGFLDIAVTSDKKLIALYQNIGGHEFIEQSENLGFSEFNKNFHSRLVLRSMNCGDFNNDGFLDIFISLEDPNDPRNYLFVNNAAKSFNEMAEEFNIKEPFVKGVTVADVDADGDLDLFGFKNGFNILWINNYNDENYLAFIPKGVESNTDGIGAKIKVYLAGHFGNQKYLFGYRQIGCDQYGYNQINQRIAHFGLPTQNKYDVEIKFYGGATRVLKNVSPGKTIAIEEYAGVAASLYTFPRALWRFILSHENQYYFLIVVISLLFLFAATKYGIKKFKWNVSTSLSIVIVNLSLFWLLILLTSSSGSILVKYFLPLIIICGGMFLPLFIFSTLRKVAISNKPKSDLEDDLLMELLHFLHGEWALRNISGLLFLFQNYPAEKDRKEKYYELVKERLDTFNELTKPILEKIIELSACVEIGTDKTSLLGDHLSKSAKLFSESITSGMDEEQISDAAFAFFNIKNEIKEIKETVFRYFSCQPESVVKKIADEYSENNEQKGISIRKMKNYDVDKYALIKSDDLGLVIDNCIQNSIKAIDKEKISLIEILLNWNAPQLVLEIRDNGKGIEKNKWEKIFEAGYSESGSTGSGLATSKKIVEKYNGRIFVKESCPGKGTTISIELNEGIK